MALYQNFTTSSSGTIIIPGPIIGTHTSNTIANIFTVGGNVGIGTTSPSGTLDINGNVSISGNSNTIGNIFTTGGNVGIGTTTPESRFQVVLPTNVDASWRNLTFRGTSLWGDGITTYNLAGVYTSGSLYGTLMNVMLTNPHITSHFGDTARIRFGRAGGVVSGAWWETGVKTDGSWHIGQSGINNNFIITTGGNVGINLASPTEKLHVSGNIKATGTGIYGTNSILSIEDQTTFTRLAANELRIWDNNYGDTLYVNHPGIGIYKSPAYALDINGSRLSLHNAAGTGGGQNLFEGVENTTIRAQIVLSSMYSDLVIASSQANDVHGSTLTFASYNPSNKEDYRKWVINQGNWGSRVHMLEFGYNPNNEANPHIAIGDTYTTMTLDGTNKRVGISNRSPSFKLDVNGDFRAYGGRYIIQNSQDGGTGRGIYMWAENDPNWAIYMGQSGTTRSFSGGTATTGVYGFAAHAVRFRVANNTSNGWIFENHQEGHAASIRADGQMYVAGNLGLGVVSPGYKLDVNGTVNASSLRVNGVSNCHIPTGGIIMWSGSTATIPTGWAICDGANGTPDLRNRFIIGAGNSYAVAATGGVTTNTLTAANLPPHTHSGTTGYMNQNWSHSHETYMGDKDDLNCTHGWGQYPLADGPGAYWTGIYTGAADINHTHNFTTDNGPGSSTSFTNLPPYYALAFIMKL